MRIQIFTDAWLPQINGVVTTLTTTKRVLEKQGHDVNVVSPGQFWTYPCPTYKEIRLPFNPAWRIGNLIKEFSPNAIHIATEGPIGWAARRFCLREQMTFSTSFHTRFPEYVKARFGVPRRWVYSLLQRFHDPAARTMVPTHSILNSLATRGFRNLALWSRGVDVDRFRPLNDRQCRFGSKGPVVLYVGRIAVEKNLSAFFELKTDGLKVVVGDGPLLSQYRAQFSEVHFTGALTGDELSHAYASADVFVFPSKTDTFGLVMLEALASGVPVAAYPVEGPLDVIRDHRVGCLNKDLQKAVDEALKLNRRDCRTYALQFSWETAARQFFNLLQPVS